MTDQISRKKQQTDASRILLVDDDTDFRNLITKQLGFLGYEVSSLVTAGEFLTEIIAAGDAYDLAIIDLRLPDLGGGQIISWLRESEEYRVHSMPILIVTGYPKDVPTALNVDPENVAVLRKPYSLDDLEQAVATLVRHNPPT